MPEPSSDMSLIERYNRSRDASAFMEIVQRHQDFVFGVCYRVLKNGADAEDAAQEAFLRLAKKAGEVRAPLSGWLHHVATCAALDLRRRRASDDRRRQNIPATNDTSGVQSLIEDVDEALSQLPPEQRALLVEHFLRQRTQAELAAEMEVSPATLSRRVDDAVESLRQKLKKTGVLSAGVLLCLQDPVQLSAPPTLRAGLGKIALSGVGKAAVGGGGSLIAACGLIGAIVVAIGAAALHVVSVPVVVPPAAPPIAPATPPPATITKVTAIPLDRLEAAGEPKSLFSRFSLDARTALINARLEATRRRHGVIDTDDLLLGTAMMPDGPVAKALLEQNASVDSLRAAAARIRPDGTVVKGDQIPFVDAAVTAMKAAVETFGNQKDDVGTRHLMLGLLADENNFAIKVLKNCGTDIEKLKAKLAEGTDSAGDF